jgi:hypothetical protein
LNAGSEASFSLAMRAVTSTSGSPLIALGQNRSFAFSSSTLSVFPSTDHTLPTIGPHSSPLTTWLPRTRMSTVPPRMMHLTSRAVAVSGRSNTIVSSARLCVHV